jgi:hypothetical protein
MHHNVHQRQPNPYHDFDQKLQNYYLNLKLQKTEQYGLQIEIPSDKMKFLQRHYDYHLKQAPFDKLKFLENTLLKRKSLVVSQGVSKKRQ